MDHSLGKCSECGAEYKIPASFPHDVARCKVCSGTVRLGPAGGSPPAEAPKEMPARKVAPTAQSASGGSAGEAPKKKKKKGDTLARLKAQRQAAAEKPAPAKKAAAPKKAAPAKSRPAAKAKAAASAKPARAAGGSRRRAAAKDDEGGSKKGARRPRREAQPKKKPIGGMIGIAALLLIVAGVVLFKDSIFPGEPDEVAAQDSSTEAEADTNDEGTEAGTDEGTEAPDEGTEDPVEAPEEEPAADPSEEADATPKEKPKPKLSDIDLSEFNFGPDTGVSDEEWEEMNGWMATWMDIDAGAAGNRSKRKLLDKKRAAVPVILNHMKTLDFTTEEGKSNGDQCQKGLEEILNGANFSWKYTTSEEDAYFNKTVVRNFCLIWEKASDNLEYWIKTAKLDDRDPDEADRLRELFGVDGGGGGSDAPFEGGGFDDDGLDVD